MTRHSVASDARIASANSPLSFSACPSTRKPSSNTRRNIGAVARRSRQARRPASAPAAGIDAASMARRCQNLLQNPRMFSSTRQGVGAAGWAGAPIAGATGATRAEAPGPPIKPVERGPTASARRSSKPRSTLNPRRSGRIPTHGKPESGAPARPAAYAALTSAKRQHAERTASRRAEPLPDLPRAPRWPARSDNTSKRHRQRKSGRPFAGHDRSREDDLRSALRPRQHRIERRAGSHRRAGLLDVGHVVAADVHRLALHVGQLADDGLLA